MKQRIQNLQNDVNTKKSRCFTSDSLCGGKGNRTPDLLNAIQTLYQLSYTPKTITKNIIRTEAV